MGGSTACCQASTDTTSYDYPVQRQFPCSLGDESPSKLTAVPAPHISSGDVGSTTIMPGAAGKNNESSTFMECPAGAPVQPKHTPEEYKDAPLPALPANSVADS